MQPTHTHLFPGRKNCRSKNFPFLHPSLLTMAYGTASTCGYAGRLWHRAASHA
jgi:hypothetical protein